MEVLQVVLAVLDFAVLAVEALALTVALALYLIYREEPPERAECRKPGEGGGERVAKTEGLGAEAPGKEAKEVKDDGSGSDCQAHPAPHGGGD